MKAPSSGQVTIACAAVAILALWSSINFYAATATLVTPEADVYKVGDQPARFQELMSQIPETAVVGYVSDLPITDNVGAALYSSARFTLAPRLVTNTRLVPAPQWTIGDFSKPLDMARFGAEHGLTLVKDYGQGIVLYRNQAR